MTTLTTQQHIEIADKLAAQTAPKVTPEHLESIIVRAEYYQVPDTLLIICTLVLKNGFTVTGESACVSPENFIKEVGQQYAYRNAFQKLWPLEGYLLASKLFEEQLNVARQGFAKAMAADSSPFGSSTDTFVGLTEVRAVAMSRASYNVLRGWKLPADEDGNDEGYYIEDILTGHPSWIPKEVFSARYSLKKVASPYDEGYPYS